AVRWFSWHEWRPQGSASQAAGPDPTTATDTPVADAAPTRRVGLRPCLRRSFMRRHLVLPFLLLLALLAVSFASVAAQSSVTIVPQGLSFTALTPDAQLPLLHNYPTQETWLWTEAGGLQLIGQSIAAQGLSADGQTVAGARDVG